jgi:hypothetical protein
MNFINKGTLGACAQKGNLGNAGAQNNYGSFRFKAARKSADTSRMRLSRVSCWCNSSGLEPAKVSFFKLSICSCMRRVSSSRIALALRPPMLLHHRAESQRLPCWTGLWSRVSTVEEQIQVRRQTIPQFGANQARDVAAGGLRMAVPRKWLYFLYTVGCGPFSSVSRSQIIPSRLKLASSKSCVSSSASVGQASSHRPQNMQRLKS